MCSLDAFLKSWLKHEEWWFSKNAEYDHFITETYQHLLDEPEEALLEQSTIGTIIVWDQLPRHIYRGHAANHIITYYLDKACQTARKHHSDSFIKTLSAREFMFFWLPYRHTKEYRLINIVMSETWKRIALSKEEYDIRLLKKFMRATYSNCPKEDQTFMIDHYRQERYDHTYNDILEYDGKNATNKHIDIPINKIQVGKHLLVSLSGGVDSMVSLSILKNIYRDAHIIAVHINYDNRMECKQEVSFLQKWCKDIHIDLVVRTIGELHRKECMENGLRDLYEGYTKAVRFGTYKTVWRQSEEEHNPIVVLGHNRDDCFENCLTNATYKTKYDNLHGMSEVSEQEGICFWRPLLKVPKSQIIKYAHRHKIPYLKDSTVSWSQRGQIRDVIVPALKGWNANAIEGVLSIGDVLSELFSVLKQSSDEWCQDITEVQTQNDNCRIFRKVCKTIPTSQLFWKEVFMHVCKTCISNKSMNNLLSRLNAFHASTNKEVHVKHKVVLKKGYILYYSLLKNGTYSIELSVPPR